MSIQLVYNWRHGLIGWKKTEDRRQKIDRYFVSLSFSHRYDCDAISTGVTAKE